MTVADFFTTFLLSIVFFGLLGLAVLAVYVIAKLIGKFDDKPTLDHDSSF